MKALSGNDVAAEAMKQINPHVLAAYPITPSTGIIERFAEYKAKGEVETEIILAESEHSALSVCIGASSAGARAMTATSSQGLALMSEIAYVCAGMRLPVVMNVANRVLSAPILIYPDHSDSMSVRDSGWIQLYAENVQEVYDNVIQAIKIAEDKNVKLPAMCMFDGFITSHTIEKVDLLPDTAVQEFIGRYRDEESLLDIENPKTLGYIATPDIYFEIKRKQIEAIENAKDVIGKVGEEYGEISGRKYSAIECYKLNNADKAVLCLGSSAGTSKAAIDSLRDNGVMAGLIKLRSFRPFPWEELRKLLEGVDALAVMDRSTSPGGYKGPIFQEVSGMSNNDLLILNYIYGIGGRDFTENHVKTVFDDLGRALEGEEVPTINYLGCRYG